MAKLTDGEGHTSANVRHENGRKFYKSGKDKEVELSPVGYNDPQAWCDWRNREMKRRDIRWIVAPNGTPMLAPDPDWEIEHDGRTKAKREKDRRDWLHRQRYPVTALRDPLLAEAREDG